MPIELIVNNTSYQYPVQGEDPGWGGEATGWASGVTSVLNSLLTDDDIVQTLFTIQNNVSVASNITGLAFDKTSARAATTSYSIYRKGVTTGSITAIASGGGNLADITATAHGLITGQTVTLSLTDSTPVVDGDYVITVLDVNTFQIDAGSPITIPGTTGSFTQLNEFVETGLIRVMFRNDSDEWDIQRDYAGDDTGVVMTINNNGQVQYTSTNIAGATYTAEMKFRASALQQDI